MSVFTARQVTFSPAGEVGLIGSFAGNPDFGGRLGYTTGTATRPYFARYSSTGRLESLETFGAMPATVDGGSFGKAVRFDSLGRTYVALTVDGYGVTLPGGGTVQGGAGITYGYVAQLLTDGGTGWVASLSATGSYANVELQDLAVSPGGNVAISGRFNTNVKLSGTSTQYSTNDWAPFYAAYGSDGTFQYSAAFTCTNPQLGGFNASTFDVHGDLYLFGYLGGNGTVGQCSDPNGIIIPGINGANAMLAKASANGSFQWSRMYPPLYAYESGALAVQDGLNAIYFAATLTGTYDGGSAGVFTTAGGMESILLQKLDYNGTPQVGLQLGPASTARATAMTMDAVGTLWMTGTFVGSGFGGAGHVLSSSTDGGSAGFIARVDPNLNLLELRGFGATGTQTGGGLALQGSTLAVSGQFSGPLVFNGAGVDGGSGWSGTRGFVGTASP